MIGYHRANTGAWNLRHLTTELRREFPGVVPWYGHATGSWWCLVPVGGYAHLVEADSPRRLRDAIAADFLTAPELRGVLPMGRKGRHVAGG